MTRIDTIFALSSGHGRAGIAVVRVSGPLASSVFELFAVSAPQPRSASVRTLRGVDGSVVDQALCLWLPSPATVTGEDMAELHVHGSPAIVDAVLRQLSQVSNFRLAEPGEFTRRAFENDRLDLLQVEGLSDLLNADSEPQRRLAMRQFLGENSSIFLEWRDRLLKALGLAEAAIDFNDEVDVAASALTQSQTVARALVVELELALQRADRIAAVRRGLLVVIAGPPNVGKSSLLNRIAAEDVAIVSPIAGTTRDIVETAIMVGGVTIRLADTAGLRLDSSDVIENEGMERARRRLRDADIVVWVEDGHGISGFVDLERVPELKVANKSDKIDEAQSILLRNDGWQLVSAKSGDGVAALLGVLSDLIRDRIEIGDHDVVVRERHRLAVHNALEHLKLALTRSEDSLEFIVEDMRKAARYLGGVTGRIDVEDILGKIFQDFCIGK